MNQARPDPRGDKVADEKMLARWRGRLPSISWVDAVAAFLGVLFGAASLGYPFGRDQGLYYYIGREWLLRGALPYRDSFDVKTPGVYLLHAISIALFGERQWGIRVLDLVGIVALGWIAGALAAPWNAPASRGVRGLAVLGASVFYYGFFDYWNTAQCELWCATFSMAGLWLVARGELGGRRIAAAGAMAGVAVVFKPPAVWFAALAFVVVCARAPSWRARAKSAGVYASSAAGLVALVPAYFAIRGGLPALYDVLVVNNRHYVSAGAWVHSTAEVWTHTRDAYRTFDPMATVLFHALSVGIGVGVWKRNSEIVLRHALPMALAVLAFGAVLMQLKFVWYHWGLLAAAGAVTVAVLAQDLIGWLEKRGSRRAALAVVGLASVYVWLLFATTGRSFDRWSNEVSMAASYSSGGVSRDLYMRSFTFGPPMPFSYEHTEIIGQWVRDHSEPTDTIAVRGFEPQIYAVAQRRYPGRFFWTTFLVRPEWAYNMDAWIEEDRQIFLHTPPRYVLALSWVHSGVDSAEYFEPLGYVRRQELFAYVIMEYRGL